jgi:hypothetical protein
MEFCLGTFFFTIIQRRPLVPAYQEKLAGPQRPATFLWFILKRPDKKPGYLTPYFGQVRWIVVNCRVLLLAKAMA